MSVVEERPAELGAIVAAVIAVLIAFGVALSEEQVVALLGLVGVVPGIVTFVVESRKRA